MTANEYTAGDLVEAVKGETVIRGRLMKSGHYLWVGDSGRTPENIESYGFTVSVVEKAAPVVVLPTEPGVYATYVDSSRSQLIHRLNDGRWTNANQNHDMTDEMVAHCLPLTRLEPVPVTAKKILDRVWDWPEDCGEDFTDFLITVAEEFGVEL